MSLEEMNRVLGEESITIDLAYHPPFDWDSLLAIFRAHQLPDLELADTVGYERIFALKGRELSSFRVTHNGSRHRSLRLLMTGTPPESVSSVARSVRRMFDLDADPVRITESMAAEPYLAEVWKRYPGLRIARSWDRFETLITTVLGQLVSVSFGRTLIRELMQSAGTEARHPATGASIFLFPTPEQLASHDLTAVRTSEMRRTAIRAIAQLVSDKVLLLDAHLPPKELRKILLSVPGIGAWSSEYIAMRGFDDDDAFPATDYGLKQQIKRHPEMIINNVRPLRAYAAAALWKSFAEAKGVNL